MRLVPSGRKDYHEYSQDGVCSACGGGRIKSGRCRDCGCERYWVPCEEDNGETCEWCFEKKRWRVVRKG